MSFGSNIMPKRFGQGNPAKRKRRLCKCSDARRAADAEVQQWTDYSRKYLGSSCPKCGEKKPRGAG